MRLINIWLAGSLLWASNLAFALDLNSSFYAVYEKSTSSGRTIYIVPTLSILVVASDIDIPIAFMPDVPGIQATLGTENRFKVISQNTYTANDMAALGATLSSYKLFSADFTGDGQQDFLLQGSGSRESGIITAGTGTPQLYYRFGTELKSDSVQLVLNDYNSDGRMDIRAMGTNQTYYISGYVGFDKRSSWSQNYDSNMTGYTMNLTGSIDGKFGISEQGEATYSASILTMRGTAGVTPKISLEYLSATEDGIAGPGWSIGGLSAITRCRQTLARDGALSGITLSASDRFCLDGQRLMLTEGVYGAANSKYRTEIDSYAVITAYGGSPGNPDYFTVQRKDGSTSYFGKDNSSAQNIPGTTLHLSWAISRFEDSVGNPIKFSYVDDADGHRISRIDYAYGSNFSANGNSDTFIEFIYQNRPDPHSYYVSGWQLNRTQRLSVIRSVNSGIELRNYRLTYRSTNSLQPQSYVQSLAECVNKECLQPTTFTWATSQSDFSLVTQVGTSTGYQEKVLRTMDINGDGKADLIYMNSSAPYQMYYQIWNGTGYSAPVALPAGLVGEVAIGSSWQILDYNNDGKQDLLVGGFDNVLEDFSGTWKLFLGSAAGLVPHNGGNGDTGISFFPWSSLVDLDGDGLVDLASTSISTEPSLEFVWVKRVMQRVANGNSWTYQWGPAQPFAVDLSTVPSGKNDSFQLDTSKVIDFNGDGKVELSGDYVKTESSSKSLYRHAILAQDSGGTYRVTTWGKDITSATKPRTINIDLNNDSLVDLLTLTPDSSGINTTWRWRYALNTGSTFTDEILLGSTSELPDLQMVDYNRDGYQDLLYTSGGSYVVRLFDPISGTFDSAPLNTNFPFTGAENDQYVFADIDGDGRVDALRSVKEGGNTGLYLYRSNFSGTPVNRITRIDNGLGKFSDITYKPMTDSSVYTPSTTANVKQWPSGAEKPYPVFDQLAAKYVVAGMQITAPAAGVQPGAVNYGATRSFSYRYSGAKLQAGGRGSLGFETVKVTDNQSGVVTTTTYRQDFPHIGQATIREMKTASGVVMQYNTNHTTAVEVPALNNTRYYRLYVDKTTETRRDPVTAVEIGYVETEITNLDAWGNVIDTSTSTSSAGSHLAFLTKVVTHNTYGGTEWEKQVGRLTRADITYKRNCVDNCADIPRVTTFTYYGDSDGNMRGLLKSETVEPGSTFELTTQYTYDVFGNKTKVERIGSGSANRFVRTTYEAGRYPLATSSEFAASAAWAEHETERVTQRNEYGAPKRIEGLNGKVTDISYDILGREIFRSESTGLSVAKDYSRVGLVSGAAYKVTTNLSTGTSATEYFDALGRSIEKWQVGFNPGSQIVTKIEYDRFGQVRRQTQPYYSGGAVFWEENSYDNFGRLTTQSVPASQSESSNGATAVSTITYDGLHTTVNNALGQVRQEWRNAVGELTRVEDTEGGSVEYAYNAQGLLRSTTSRDQDSPQVSIHSYLSYDALGRKTKIIDSDKGTWFYQYNSFGDLTGQHKIMSENNYGGDLAPAITAGVVQTTLMEYDRRGRMIARQDLRGDQEEGSARWIYDTAPNGLGQLAAESSGGFERSYSYDNKGRISTTVTMADDIPYVQTVTYDAVGRIETRLDGATNTSGILNSYNARGYLNSVADLDQPALPLYQVQNMDARGNVTSAVLGNGATSTWNYENSTGLLLNQTVISGLYGLQNLSYTWDALGNQKSRRDQGLVSVATNTNRDLKQSFCYDGLNRLIKTHQGVLNGNCSMAVVDQDQQYDAFGNITSKAGIGAYTYMSARPRTLESTGDGVSYTYDAVGNMLSDDSGREMSYNVFDKLDFVQKGSAIVGFVYGPDRAMYKRIDFDSNTEQLVVATTVGGVEKVEKPDGSYDIRRYIENFALWTEHFDSTGTSLGIEKQYLHKDILGSTVLITDGSAAIKQQLAFSAWGERVALSDWQSVLPASNFLPVEAQRTNQGFTGHEMVDVVGLIHMKGRIYDARLGRFIQADPLIRDLTDSQALNRYAYVRNAPLHRSDPTGYMDNVVVVGNPGGGGGLMTDGPDMTYTTYANNAKAEERLIEKRVEAAAVIDAAVRNLSPAVFDDACQSCLETTELEPLVVTADADLTSTDATGNKFAPPNNGKKNPPVAPPGVDIDKNIEEARGKWSPWWFRDQVRNKGPWDYKQKGREYEDFGNFNYGATGAAFGFPAEVLLNEAGRAQKAAGTSSPSWGKPGPALLPFLGTGSHGDDPKDNYWVKEGIDYTRNPEAWNKPRQNER